MLGEDPFAVHLLALSASKMLRDVARQTNASIVGDFTDIVRPEFREELQEILSDLYNFLKHGMRDFHKGMGVRDIPGRNAMELTFCILNHHLIYKEYTQHMRMFLTFIRLWAPTTFLPEGFKDDDAMINALFSGITPRQFFAEIAANPSLSYPNFLDERAEDTRDAESFYDTPFNRSLS
jgi:hypothetical protein